MLKESRSRRWGRPGRLLQLLAIAAGALALAGCGDSGPGPVAQNVITSFPTTLSGELIVSVAEGMVDENGYSDINWADLETDSGSYLVEVSGELLKKAGATPDGGSVHATLGSSTSESGVVIYKVIALRGQ